MIGILHAMGSIGTGLRRALFGDRIGEMLFLFTILFVATTWRVGFLINDNYALANGVVALRDGSLHLMEIRYGPAHGMTPGVRYADGYVVARQYGMLVLALPFVWLLEGISQVAELRVALAAGWSLGAIALLQQVGTHIDRPIAGALVGSVVGVGVFLSNVALATPLSTEWIPLMALQLQTMMAAGFVTVLVYRLVGMVVDWKVGAVAGLVAVVGTPVGFWAPLPKRHVLVGCLALLAITAFAVSRYSNEGALRHRMVMYAAVGVSAWVSPAEGLVLLVVLAPIDLATAGRPDARELALLSGVLFVSLLPLFVTNYLISGNPLVPPRMLPAYRGQTPVLVGDLATVGAVDDTGLIDASSTFDGTTESTGFTGPLSTRLLAFGALLLTAVPERFADLGRFLTRGIRGSLTDPSRLVHTFVYGGYMPSIAARDGGEAVTMSLLESMPIAAPAVLGPVVALRAGRERCRRWLTTPGGQVDLLAVVYVVVLTTLYLHRLPVHATVTVRYLVPAMPPLLYIVCRLPPFARALSTDWRTVLWSMALVVLLVGQLLLALLAITEATLGEAVQLHARLGLAVAGALVLWALVPRLSNRSEIGAGLFGAGAGLVTIFLLLSSWEFFWYAGEHALPIAEWVASVIRFG